jgi:putative glutamine amidotransferase
MSTEKIKLPKDKNRPVVALSADFNDEKVNLGLSYSRALYTCGALPVVLCPTDDKEVISQLAERFDGVVFTGGIDISPEFYGESFCHEKTEVSRARDLFELSLFKAFYERKKPILGICRGIQLINVALGGTLFQHIENHSGVNHTVRVSGRLLALSENKNEIITNSTHHQALKDLGKNLEIVARAEDGFVEGVCDFSGGRYLLGVQFHPEKSFAEDSFSRAIIRDFVENLCGWNK